MKYGLSSLHEIDALLHGSERILIASDFDGTLCPIANTPGEVQLSEAMIEILCHVSRRRRLTLAVVSGRGLADISRRLPPDLVVAGNHGLEIAGNGIEFEHRGAREARPVIAAACDALQVVLAQWPAASIEDKGLSATLHFRNVDQRQHHSLLFTARRVLGAFGPKLALRVGSRALEVGPRVPWNKGTAVGYIREKLGPFDACICLGDDRTDESMFRAEACDLGIRVGRRGPTAASHYLKDPAEVAILLSHLADLDGIERRPGAVASASAAEIGSLVGASDAGV